MRKNLSCPENLIYIAFASVFMPYIITGMILAVLGIYILCSQHTRTSVFVHNGSSFFFLFTVYTALIALIRDNYIGFVCSLGFFMVFVISYFVRSEITSDIFQKALDICCWMSVVVFVSVVAENLVMSHDEKYRCAGWFFNSNYLCTMMAMMVIVCTYKIIVSQKGRPFYCLIALLCGITMYIAGSIFAFIEVIVGIFTLLILYRKHSVIATVLAVLAIALLALYIFPEIFPRILQSNTSTEQRIRVWDSSLEFIKISPLFGHGFLSYYHLQGIYGSLWKTAHTHNFLFEPILSFGIIGSLFFLIFLWSYYEKVSECKSLLRRQKTTNLILAISAATIIHCTVDLTVMWIQTGLFFALILAGIGVDEKTLNLRIKACLAKSQKSQKSSEEENK